MRFTNVVASLHDRVRHGSRLLTLLVVGILLCVIQLLTSPFPLPLPLMVLDLVIPFAVIGLGPIPWQWTGDDVPKAGFLRGLLQALCLFGALIGVITLCSNIWGQPIAHQLSARAAHHLHYMAGLGMGALTLVVIVGFGRILSEMEEREAKQRATAELLRESQRRALQNQLEPHVLYNALNSLAGLIEEDQETAEEVVVLLADLYRLLAKQGGVARIPLSEERRVVNAYLVMEGMRLGERLEAQWNWGDGSDQVMVPPLILQPLVENAIKHGIAPSEKGGTVVITYDRQGETHILRVANTGHAPDQGAHRGIGMGNLEARLALWDEATEGRLCFSRKGEWTLAEVCWVAKGVA